MKTQVYSWRLDNKLKSALEEAARNNDVTISGLLEDIVTEWLQSQPTSDDDAEVQRLLHLAASECAGKVKGGDSGRSQNVQKLVREKLKHKRAG
jgi:hypothetical protein